jgi:hypothetical protein
MNGVKIMDANLHQLRRIHRCYRFIARRHPYVPLEVVARLWIERYAEQWRDHHQAV